MLQAIPLRACLASLVLAAGLGAQTAPPGMIRSALGVTRRATPIECWLTADDLNYNTAKTRILLIGGLDKSASSVASAQRLAAWFYTARDAKPFQGNFAISVVPNADPDGAAAHPDRGYPPQGEAYGGPNEPEAAYLWRWIGMHAPDLVVELRAGERATWYIPEAEPLGRLSAALKPAHALAPSDELVSQLVRLKPSGTGTVPAVRMDVPANSEAAPFRALLAALQKLQLRGPSPARREIQRRLTRTPLEVARQLSVPYGHELDQVVYISALSLLGRIRLGELANDPRPLADVERIVAPYFTGAKPAMPAKPTGSDLAGNLVFGELARFTAKPRYIELVRAAADFGFDERGSPKDAMPFHNEMSDAFFMGCPILAQAGRLTGEPKYFDMCLRHMGFMLKLTLRPDGLHRHSPLDEAAWGRGNGFPALGLALSLTDLPQDYPGRAEILQAFRAHIQALLPHQDPTGAWHEVIDVPASYRELTATCMITFAMMRGVRAGWLDREKYAAAIDRAWYAIRTRVAPNGDLVDVCTGTGKQRSLRDYLDRTAILGPDPRGGAMALLAATEAASYR